MNPARRFTPSRPPFAPACRRPGSAGFTLVEVLTVVALLGILAAIIIPTAGGARTAATKARTRAQFSQWAAGIEQFRQEYGSYPQFYTQGLVNQSANTAATLEHLFYDTLTGQRRDTSGSWIVPARDTRVPPLPQTQNPRRVRFLSFTESDLVASADVSAGYNTAQQLNFVRDAFHNTSIAVVVDRNLDGIINGADMPSGAPRVTVPGTTTTLTPAIADLPTARTGGIHTGVIFYCAPPNATSNADLLMSWK